MAMLHSCTPDHDHGQDHCHDDAKEFHLFKSYGCRLKIIVVTKKNYFLFICAHICICPQTFFALIFVFVFKFLVVFVTVFVLLFVFVFVTEYRKVDD